MKKTMFITSIVMVVVLAVALTTSSLAWFSAAGATTVTVSQLKLEAKGRVTTSGLEISNNGSVWSTDSIDFQPAAEITVLVDDDNNPETPSVSQGTGTFKANGTFAPLAPVGAISVVEDNDEIANNEKYVDADFFAALNNMYTAETYEKQIITVGDQSQQVQTTQETFQGNAVTTEKPFIDTFYLRNSGEAATNVSITIEALSVENRSYDATLWVAIFDVTGIVFPENSYTVPENSEAQPKLIKLVGSKSGYTISNTVTGGTVKATGITWAASAAQMANEQPVSGMGSLTLTRFDEKILNLAAGSYNGNTGVFSAGDAHKLMIYAWFDGDQLDNSNAGASVTINVSFAVSNS